MDRVVDCADEWRARGTKASVRLFAGEPTFEWGALEQFKIVRCNPSTTCVQRLGGHFGVLLDPGSTPFAGDPGDEEMIAATWCAGASSTSW